MTLFAEIAGAAPRRNATLREDVATEVERVCATRRGSLLLAPEYGIDDVTFLFHSFPMIDAWSANLARTLARYEPRLRNVQVLPVATDAPELTLHAEIRAVLVGGGRAASAHFSATVDAQCRMNVR
jgi:type VI secretion system lysozyme-like protein